MIKNVIFDIGNVLFKYEPASIISNILPKTKNAYKHQKHLFDGPIWAELEAGRIDKEQAVDLLQTDYNYTDAEKNEAAEIIKNFSTQLPLIEDMKELFEDLSEAYNVYIISNFQNDLFTELLASNSFMSKAKRIVISSEVQLLKPNPRIFSYLINKEELNPLETIIIDDLKENIKAAKKQKIKGIIHKDLETTKKELSELFEITI